MSLLSDVTYYIYYTTSHILKQLDHKFSEVRHIYDPDFRRIGKTDFDENRGARVTEHALLHFIRGVSAQAGIGLTSPSSLSKERNALAIYFLL